MSSDVIIMGIKNNFYIFLMYQCMLQLGASFHKAILYLYKIILYLYYLLLLLLFVFYIIFLIILYYIIFVQNPIFFI